MEQLLLIMIFVLLIYLIYSSQLATGVKPPIKDNSGHVKPDHLLYDVLQQFSSGDKVNLSGECQVNLYSKYIIEPSMKAEFTTLLNKIFNSVYGLTQISFQVQELNNIYEQIDSLGNKRYIIDATLHSVSNHYTVKVILDIVILQGEIKVNHIGINGASNNNIIDRYDIVYQDQGILLNHNNFTENIRSLLDTEYRKNNNLIAVDSSKLDSRNYDLNEVLSLDSLLKTYLPSNLSSESEKNLKMKGVDGLLEMYLPPHISAIKSPQFCNKYLNGWTSDGVNTVGNEGCVFDHNTTSTEYNQPYMAPGMFFNRSSLPKQGF